MKAILITLSIATSVLFVVACGKNSSTAPGGGLRCKCSGGISGSGLDTDLGNLRGSEAETKCDTYNQPGVTDGYHDCHVQY